MTKIQHRMGRYNFKKRVCGQWLDQHFCFCVCFFVFLVVVVVGQDLFREGGGGKNHQF